MLAYVTTVVGVAIGAAFLFAIVRAYRRLRGVEFLAMWWWAAIVVLGFVGIATHVHFVSGLAGVLMLGLGLFLALNMRGIADRLGSRRMGLGSLWTQYSPAYWRLSGFFLAGVGGFWTLAFGSAT
jgi:hypothetical protein